MLDFGSGKSERIVGIDELVRERKGRIGNVVQSFHLFRRKLEIERGDVLLELGESTGSDQGRSDCALLHEPVSRHLDGRLSALLGNLEQLVENREVLFGEVSVHSRGASDGSVAWLEGFARVFSGQESFGSNSPRNDSDVEVPAHGSIVSLEASFDKVVASLESDQGGPSAELGDGIGARDDPRRGVRDGAVQNFSGTNNVVHGSENFFDRGPVFPSFFLICSI